MKKTDSKLAIISTVVALLSFLSCSKDIAQDVLEIPGNFSQELTTKADNPNFQVTHNDIEWLVHSMFSENGPYEIEQYPSVGVPLVYAVNFSNGWKIISGDKRTEPILAFNDNGNVHLNSSDNPGFKIWLNEVSEAMAKLDDINDDFKKNLRFWKSEYPKGYSMPTKSSSGPRWYRQLIGEYISGGYSEYVGPLVTTEWGQGSPWNLKAPSAYGTRCPLGCVPVAVSQILYYLHFHDTAPQGLYHTIEGDSYVLGGVFNWRAVFTINRDDFTSPSNRWLDMPSSYYSALADPIGAQYVGDLIIDVGDRLHAEYIIDGTRAFDDDVVTALEYYNVTGTFSEQYNYSFVYDNIVHSRPVYIGSDSSYGFGHAWVIDGFCHDLITTRRVYAWHEADSNWHGDTYSTYEAQALLGSSTPLVEGAVYLETLEELGPKYFHMNWGWDGDHNGFYITDSSWLGYNTNRQLVYDIHATQ